MTFLIQSFPSPQTEFSQTTYFYIFNPDFHVFNLLQILMHVNIKGKFFLCKVFFLAEVRLRNGEGWHFCYEKVFRTQLWQKENLICLKGLRKDYATQNTETSKSVRQRSE